MWRLALWPQWAGREKKILACPHRVKLSALPVRSINRQFEQMVQLYPKYANFGKPRCRVILGSRWRLLLQMLCAPCAVPPHYAPFLLPDLEGKRIFLQQMEQLGERLRIFVARMKLANDQGEGAAVHFTCLWQPSVCTPLPHNTAP